MIQYDHNSERFTFDIPKEVEGHNMLDCNVVEVHYLNIDSANGQSEQGIYRVDDLQISPTDENVVIFSWLISANATQKVGLLNFLIRFSCVNDEGIVEYAWHTDIYKNIKISNGINNTDFIVTEYPDILEQWRVEILKLLQSGGTGGNGGNGFSPIVKFTETDEGVNLTITDVLGVKSTTIKHGDDGYTPVKGVDYFTDEERQEIIDATADAIGVEDLDLGSYATKEYVQLKISEAELSGSEVDLTLYALKSEVNKQIEEIELIQGPKGDKGDTGYTPQKGIDYFDGQNGKDGQNGISVTHVWNGTNLSVTSASGTSSANLKGEQGNSGVVISETAPQAYSDGRHPLWLNPNGNMTLEIPNQLSQLTDDATHRTVTDVEKNTWNSKLNQSDLSQADWEQNDTNAIDFIKGRTHYMEVVLKPNLNYELITTSNQTVYTFVPNFNSANKTAFARGNIRLVYGDNVYYAEDIVYTTLEEFNTSNIKTSDGLIDLTINFIKGNEATLNITTPIDGEFLIEYYERKYYPIDEKYIPSTIARVEDIPEDKGRIFGAINFSNVLSMPKTQFINTNGNWYLQSIEWVDTKNQFYIGSRNLAEFEVGVTEALIGVYDSNFNFIKSTKVNAGHINDMAFCSSNNKLYIPTADKGLYTNSIVTINIDTLEIENIYPFDRPCYQLSYDKKNNQLIGSFGGLLRWMDLDCNILKELKFDIPDYLETQYTFQSTFIVDERLFFVGCGNNDTRTIIIYEINTKTGEMIYCDTGNIGTQEVEAVTVKGEELYLLSGQYLTRIHKMPFHQFAQNSLLALDNAGELLAEGANLNNYASRVGKYRASGGAIATTMLNIPTSYKSADGGFSIWVELVAQDCFKNVLVSKSGRIFFRIWTVENGCGAWKEIQMQ